MRILRVSRLVAIALTAAALADCETMDGAPPSLALTSPQAHQAPARAPAPQAEPPMTRARRPDLLGKNRAWSPA